MENKHKYFLILTFVFCLLFYGCRCYTILNVKNEGESQAILIVDGKDFFMFEIKNNKELCLNDKIMHYITLLFIKTDTIEGIISLSEHDHWFSMEHDIKIIITEDEIILKDNSGKKIYFHSYKYGSDKLYHYYSSQSSKAGMYYSENAFYEWEQIKKHHLGNLYEMLGE
ncbi:MAG: hypothetical protein LBB89_07925 [Treponema sp.]|jgi:hypothetical protein|nr:hypothetical protein [Treponema sp.]